MCIPGEETRKSRLRVGTQWGWAGAAAGKGWEMGVGGSVSRRKLSASVEMKEKKVRSDLIDRSMKETLLDLKRHFPRHRLYTRLHARSASGVHLTSSVLREGKPFPELES